MIVDLQVVGEQFEERGWVSCGDSGIKAGCVGCRGVRAHPALSSSCRFNLSLGVGRDRRYPRVSILRALPEQCRALRLPQLICATLLCVGFAAPSRRAQRRSERETCVGMVEQSVGSRGDRNRSLSERDGCNVLAAPRECFRAHAAPGNRCLEIVACEQFAFMRERLRLGGTVLSEQRTSEKRRGLRSIDSEPEIAKSFVSTAQRAFGGDCVALQQIDLSGEHIGLEQPVRDAQLFDHLPRRGDHASGGIGAPAQRFEHALTAECDGFDRGRSLRDTQHAYDIEAAATRARDRTRAPKRGEWRTGEHGVRAAPISGATSGCERTVERSLARTDLAEPSQRLRMYEVRLGLTGCVAERRERLRRCCDRVGSRMQRLRRSKDRKLTSEAGVPRSQTLRIGDEATELLDRRRGRSDVSCGEQRLAPVERQVGTLRIFGIETIERAPEQARSPR